MDTLYNAQTYPLKVNIHSAKNGTSLSGEKLFYFSPLSEKKHKKKVKKRFLKQKYKKENLFEAKNTA